MNRAEIRSRSRSASTRSVMSMQVPRIRIGTSSSPKITWPFDER